jgi:GntR family transcriptional regulator
MWLFYHLLTMAAGSRVTEASVFEDTLKLDRTSAVPLYHQLQEVLKEQIESGLWQPGFALPSEPELGRRFGVSRVVVRMALKILEDDRQIVRIRGRGTFVAKPKLNYRASGVLRMLEVSPEAEITINVLDCGIKPVERTIREKLVASPSEPILRILSVIRLRGMPIAVGYSFFRRGDVPWLEEYAIRGTELPRDAALSVQAPGVELTQSEVSIESTSSGHFDADLFKLPPKRRRRNPNRGSAP